MERSRTASRSREAGAAPLPAVRSPVPPEKTALSRRWNRPATWSVRRSPRCPRRRRERGRSASAPSACEHAVPRRRRRLSAARRPRALRRPQSCPSQRCSRAPAPILARGRRPKRSAGRRYQAGCAARSFPARALVRGRRRAGR